MNNILYIPISLIKAKEEIKLVHRRSSRFDDKNLENEKYFKDFIKLLVKEKKSKVVNRAKSYDHENITKLCFYVNTNVFDVNCENLFIVLSNLANDSDWETLFCEWQDHYQNNEVREFIANSFSNSDEFKKFVNNSIPKGDLNWLIQKNFIEYLCENFGNVESKVYFGKTLSDLGVIYGKQLYITCLKKFLLYCNRKAYLRTETSILISSYNGYTENEKVIFINNFVSKLTIEDLDDQEKIYEAIKNSNSIKNKLDEYLKEKGTYQKYNQWVERMKLLLAFDGDRDRFDFWIKYQKGNKIIDTNRDTLYIDFGSYVITEFKGKAAGPSYLFEKEYFDRKVWHKLRSMNKVSFQQELLRLSKKGDALERLEHRPSNRGWWKYFSSILSSYGIHRSE